MKVGSLSVTVCGVKRGSFASCILLDAVWPREQMSFRVIFQEIVRLTASTADAITFRGLPGVDYRRVQPVRHFAEIGRTASLRENADRSSAFPARFARV